MKQFLFVQLLIVVIFMSDAFSDDKLPNTYCGLNGNQVTRFLLRENSVCGKSLPRSDLLNLIKSLDLYWDYTTTNEDRYKLLSETYKDYLQQHFKVVSFENYTIPFFELEKIWSGYLIEKIQQTSDKTVSIKLEIEWFQEGEYGRNLYTFEWEKIDGQWKINRIFL